MCFSKFLSHHNERILFVSLFLSHNERVTTETISALLYDHQLLSITIPNYTAHRQSCQKGVTSIDAWERPDIIFTSDSLPVLNGLTTTSDRRSTFLFGLNLLWPQIYIGTWCLSWPVVIHFIQQVLVIDKWKTTKCWNFSEHSVTFGVIFMLWLQQ